jgi:tagatose-1,6-bisphosphate aldolase
MKRLFKVEYPNGTSFFSNKKEAKEERDRFNDKHKMPYATVALGPDHHRYGEKGNQKTHSHNARSGGPGTGFKKIKR